MSHYNVANEKYHSGKELAICVTEIQWDEGQITTDPNGVAMHAAYGDYPIGLPFKDRPSMLSGKPSYLYRADNFELPLTFDELDRFCRHALRPQEFLKMARELGGIIHEIHDDFYDPADGYKVQPMSKSPDLGHTKARIQALADQSAISKAAKISKPTKSKPGL